jgi:hypothetical protein
MSESDDIKDINNFNDLIKKYGLDNSKLDYDCDDKDVFIKSNQNECDSEKNNSNDESDNTYKPLNIQTSNPSPQDNNNSLFQKMERICTGVVHNKSEYQKIKYELVSLREKIKELSDCDQSVRNLRIKKHKTQIGTKKVAFSKKIILNMDVLESGNDVTFMTDKVKGFYLKSNIGELKIEDMNYKISNVNGTIQIYNLDNDQMYNGMIKKVKQRVAYFLSTVPTLPIQTTFDAFIIIKLYCY